MSAWPPALDGRALALLASAGGVDADAPFAFTLPDELEAHEPPEARGLARDAVRLLVSSAHDDAVAHARFPDLPRFLRRGDVLVVNASATLNAALPARRADGAAVTVHLSQPLAEGRWVLELRRPTAAGTQPLLDAAAGERLALPAGAYVELLAPYRAAGARRPTRLWEARLAVGDDLAAYLARYGAPIRYGYLRRGWPLSYYQTLFATEPGSAEMPSAGRPFTARVRDALLARGVAIAPLVLHTGVASLEAHEPPYPERFRVPPATAAAVNAARRRGGRVVAVGTTVVRALESAVTAGGEVAPREGWTELVVTPARPPRVVDALLTGFHEPRASHLAMLEALVGRRHLATSYAAAVAGGYLWHEFGDVHLLLADRRGRGAT